MTAKAYCFENNVLRVKIKEKDLKGNKKLLRVGRRYELLRVQVIKKKIAIKLMYVENLCRGNQF